MFAVWATSFDDVPKAGISPTPAGRSTWLAAHLLLHLGIVGVAVGVSRFVEFHPGQDIPTDDVAAVAVPMAAIYLALVVISGLSRRRPLGGLVRIRLAAVVAVGSIVVVAQLAPWFDAYWSVAAFALVAITEAGLEAVVRNGTTVLPTPPPPDAARPKRAQPRRWGTEWSQSASRVRSPVTSGMGWSSIT